ncbi:MAG: hypothetical protein ABFD18_16755 [Syntrophomonas sp.]
MGPSFSIWSPVIISELKKPRYYKNQVVYQIDKVYSSLEDIRIKIKSSEANIQGKAVETKIKLEILFLVRDVMGRLELITRGETMRDRTPLVGFSHSFNNHREAKFIIDINKISWEGGLTGRQLKAAYSFEYALLAVKEQVVQLFEDETTGDEQRNVLSDILHQLEEELTRVVEQKEELYNRISFYERNFNSLKKGFYKLENRNAALNRELSRYQEQLEQLQEQIYEKDRRLLRLENVSHDYQRQYWSKQEDKALLRMPSVGWGSRIKSMLMNIF